MTKRFTRIGRRIALLCVTAASLYLLFPSLVAVFSSWRSLRTLDWFWVQLMIIAELVRSLHLYYLPKPIPVLPDVHVCI